MMNLTLTPVSQTHAEQKNAISLNKARQSNIWSTELIRCSSLPCIIKTSLQSKQVHLLFNISFSALYFEWSASDNSSRSLKTTTSSLKSFSSCLPRQQNLQKESHHHAAAAGFSVMVRSERGVPRTGQSRRKDGRIVRFINGDGGRGTFRQSRSARRRALGRKAWRLGKRSHSRRIRNRCRGGRRAGRTRQNIKAARVGGTSVIATAGANAGCPIENPFPFRSLVLK